MRSRLALLWNDSYERYGLIVQINMSLQSNERIPQLSNVSQWPLAVQSYPYTHTTYLSNGRTVIAYCWNNWWCMCIVLTFFTWKNRLLRPTRCLNVLVLPPYWIMLQLVSMDTSLICTWGKYLPWCVTTMNLHSWHEVINIELIVYALIMIA